MSIPDVVRALVIAFAGVVFPVENPRVTLPFGATGPHPYYSDARPHWGMDVSPFAGAHGRPVMAPIASVVYRSFFSATAGRVVVLRVEAPYDFGATALNGDVHTVRRGEPFYLSLSHNHEVFVVEGQAVLAGQVIASVGSSGSKSSGPHVHVELRLHPYERGFVLNPLDFFIAAIPGLRSHLQGTTRPAFIPGGLQ